MVVKTFRGLLADGAQDRIRLSTIKGKVAYRIVKFQLMGEKPAGANQESIVKIYKTEQSTPDALVDFTNPDLLAAGYLEAAADAKTEHQPQIIFFDNEMFNQDIFISHNDDETGESCNYYLELEVIPLDDAGAEYTTLKDMRSA